MDKNRRATETMPTGGMVAYIDAGKSFANPLSPPGIRVVFNIGGNKYRLIADVHYNRGKVYIHRILTHAEYDLDLWK